MASDEEIARVLQFYDAANDMAAQATAFYQVTGKEQYKNIAVGSTMAAERLRAWIYQATSQNITPAQPLHSNLTPSVAVSTVLQPVNPRGDADLDDKDINSVVKGSASNATVSTLASTYVAPTAPSTTPAMPTTQWKIPAREWTPRTPSPVPAAAAPTAPTAPTSRTESADDLIENVAKVQNELEKMLEMDIAKPAPAPAPSAGFSPVASWKGSIGTASTGRMTQVSAHTSDAIEHFPDAGIMRVAESRRVYEDFRRRFTSVELSPNIFVAAYESEKANKWHCDSDTSEGFPLYMEQLKRVGETNAKIPSGLTFCRERDDVWTVTFYYDGHEMFSERGRADIGKSTVDTGVVLINKWAITWVRQKGRVTVRSVSFSRGKNPLQFLYKI